MDTVVEPELNESQPTTTSAAPADNLETSGVERRPHPTDPNRWADGTFRDGGDGGNLQAGVRRYELRGVLPADARAHVDSFGQNLVADRGGDLSAIEVGYCRRLTQLEGALELLGQDIAARGVMTQRGRPRAAYRVFLDTLATWDRLATRLGLGRKAKSLTFDEALAAAPEAR